MKRGLRVSWVLASSSVFCFLAYLAISVLSSSQPVQSGAGRVTMMLMEPKLDAPLNGTMPFRVKIVSGDPGIVKGMQLKFFSERSRVFGPFDMWHISSSSPHTETFWYVSVDTSRIPSGKYNLTITAYDSQAQTVGGLFSVVTVGPNIGGSTNRNLLAWLSGLLATASVIAHYFKV